MINDETIKKPIFGSETSLTRLTTSLKSITIAKIKPICKGCGKYYINDKALQKHQNKNNLCKTWISLLEKNNLALKIQKIHEQNDVCNNTDEPITCTSCNKNYSNVGNLNKHLKNNSICRKLKDFLTYSFENN